MSDLYERQVALEEAYSTESVIASQKQVLDAFKQGRASDMSSGRILVAKAFEASYEPYMARINTKTRGVGGKYLNLLRKMDAEVVIMIGLRSVLNHCANPTESNMQKILGTLGRELETESVLTSLKSANAAYANKTIQYLDASGTRSTSHRYRSLIAGVNNIGLGWDTWTPEERVALGRIVMEVLYYSTGLFKWVMGDKDIYYMNPTDELRKYLADAVDSAKSVVRLPPMLIPPVDWTSQFEGGYTTEWCRAYSPMCGLGSHTPEQRQWVYKQLESDGADEVRTAMNKAQGTPYRVNTKVLQVLRQATAMRIGILGLPSTVSNSKPALSLPDDWMKSEATLQEMDQFNFWKRQMAAWYTEEAKRIGRTVGILGGIRELGKYKDEVALYFPTFIDWRGRMYFRSSIHPQLNDSVRGCLEFAEGKRLGTDGLHWLKVHVANCCGYDKHDPVIKAAWCDENWGMINDFLNNPFDIDAPESDSAFSLLQAGYALQDAYKLDNPEDYVCHVAVAMDASCSGLQHLSALTRDEVGGYHTNLIDNGTDQKSDIYMHVATIADGTKASYAKDAVAAHYWEDKPITRNMAKSPVMTFVYGSTLLSTLDTITLDMHSAGMEAIKDDSGNVIYSLGALSVSVAKALRAGVETAVPRCAEMMKYIQNITRKTKDSHLQWVTPVGVPVVNWSEGIVVKDVRIVSMGVNCILMTYHNGKYNTRAAANGIVPNFVHSMDAAHLCKTINEFTGSIAPIHDSFGTHPSDVTSMHKALRSTFVDLYKDYSIADLLIANNIDTDEFEIPELGKLDLNNVLEARFMFG